MFMTKHPTTRAERIKLSEVKDNKTKDGASKVRRRQKNAIKEKEAIDEITSVINNRT